MIADFGAKVNSKKRAAELAALVEMRGIEPRSEKKTIGTTTSLVRSW